jgi:hypothetical protein
MTVPPSEFLSVTRLAEQMGIEVAELRASLQSVGWITKADGGWSLTPAGEAAGGKYLESKRFGRYIAWPASAASDPRIGGSDAPAPDIAAGQLTPTKIGEELGLSATRVNFLLSELGWIEKGLKGWKLTKQGAKIGGVQREHHRSGIPFVVWPAHLLENKSFKDSAAQVLGSDSAPTTQDSPSGSNGSSGFREKFEAKHRATDGHFVRSKAEMLIDNWLYMAEIVHAYERKLPIEEEMYCDFYIPTGKVYIEYWGLENDPKYRDRKAQKLALYEKYGFNLIELNDADVQNLDDVLPRLLLKFGVQTY